MTHLSRALRFPAESITKQYTLEYNMLFAKYIMLADDTYFSME